MVILKYRVVINKYHVVIHKYHVVIHKYRVVIHKYRVVIRKYRVVIRKYRVVIRKYRVVIHKYRVSKHVIKLFILWLCYTLKKFQVSKQFAEIQKAKQKMELTKYVKKSRKRTKKIKPYGTNLVLDLFEFIKPIY